LNSFISLFFLVNCSFSSAIFWVLEFNFLVVSSSIGSEDLKDGGASKKEWPKDG
jgi:hypothetical protein